MSVAGGGPLAEEERCGDFAADLWRLQRAAGGGDCAWSLSAGSVADIGHGGELDDVWVGYGADDYLQMEEDEGGELRCVLSHPFARDFIKQVLRLRCASLRRMGHGTFVFGKDEKQVLRLPFAALRVAQDDKQKNSAEVGPSFPGPKIRTRGTHELMARPAAPDLECTHFGAIWSE
jgi:hypothetical protein